MNIYFIFYLIWILLFTYFVHTIGTFDKGIGKLVILCFINVTLLLLMTILNLRSLAFLLITGIFLLYALFYDREPFLHQWRPILYFGSLLVCFNQFSSLKHSSILFLCTQWLLLLSLIEFSRRRGYLNPWNAFITVVTYLILSLLHLGIAFVWPLNLRIGSLSLEVSNTMMHCIILLLGVLMFLLIEGTLTSYQNGYEVKTADFQQNIMLHQYDEIKNIYMNMRGWRHDYHNHLQVIKANMTLQNYNEVYDYLNALEEDLDRVDTYVKSGNLMLDAILNSKLSIAEQLKIAIHCKVQVPDNLNIADVDLCVILGNLLDNAIEGCAKILENQRFLRIYILVNKQQFYLSIQNSTKEELSFNEKHYITNKRGNHGLGLKRVKILVEKYDGFINLQNEPGIFAAELTLPFVEEKE